MTLHDDSGYDPRFEELIRRADDHLLSGYSGDRIEHLAQQCIAKAMRRRRWRRTVLVGAGIAGALLLVALGWWCFRPEFPQQQDKPPPRKDHVVEPAQTEYEQAPPVEMVSADQWPAEVLGPAKNPPESNIFNLILQPIPVNAAVAVLELRGDDVVLRTATDDSCRQALAGAPLPLTGMPFRKHKETPIHILILWTDRPCGDALAAAVDEGVISGFSPTTVARFLANIGTVLEKHGNNKIIRYRLVTIPATHVQKGG